MPVSIGNYARPEDDLLGPFQRRPLLPRSPLQAPQQPPPPLAPTQSAPAPTGQGPLLDALSRGPASGASLPTINNGGMITQGDGSVQTANGSFGPQFFRATSTGGDNPLGLVEQAASSLTRSLTGNMGVPLDIANRMAVQGTMNLYQGAPGDVMRDRQATGQLALGTMGMMGANGVPGSMASNALNSQANYMNATNQRAGEDAQRDALGGQIYRDLIQRNMSHDMALAQMRQQGQPIPRSLGGTSPAQSSGASSMPSWWNPSLQPPPLPGQGAQPLPPHVPMGQAPTGQNASAQSLPPQILAAFRMGQQIVNPSPVAANGQVVTPNPAARNDAITTVLESISDDAMLRQHWPAIQQELLGQFGGADSLNQWMNASNALTNRMGANSNRQQQQISRLLAMAGMTRTPITPWNTHATMGQRILSALPPAGLGNWLSY